MQNVNVMLSVKLRDLSHLNTKHAPMVLNCAKLNPSFSKNRTTLPQFWCSRLKTAACFVIGVNLWFCPSHCTRSGHYVMLPHCFPPQYFLNNFTLWDSPEKKWALKPLLETVLSDLNSILMLLCREVMTSGFSAPQNFPWSSESELSPLRTST